MQTHIDLALLLEFQAELKWFLDFLPLGEHDYICEESLICYPMIHVLLIISLTL